ncbi:MAG: RHS repeat-associated core domain-containing protein [Candidatus Brocadiia bacterium]
MATYITPFLDDNLYVNRYVDSNWQTYYYMHDGLGSVSNIISSSNVLKKNYQYYAFGEMKSETGNGLANRYKFTGRELDNESGQYYYRTRMYNTSTGRFSGRDSVEYEGGVNLYSYVGSNPVNNTDPYGLLWLTAPTVYASTVFQAINGQNNDDEEPEPPSPDVYTKTQGTYGKYKKSDIEIVITERLDGTSQTSKKEKRKVSCQEWFFVEVTVITEFAPGTSCESLAAPIAGTGATQIGSVCIGGAATLVYQVGARRCVENEQGLKMNRFQYVSWRCDDVFWSSGHGPATPTVVKCNYEGKIWCDYQVP